LARWSGWAKRFFERVRYVNAPAGGVVQMDSQPGRIYDGVPYMLPVVIPQGIRESAEQTASFLESVAVEFQHQFGSPFPKGGPFRIPSVASPLQEWTRAVRQYVLEQCHLALERNPIAKTAVFYNRAFSVQNGASISYRNQDVKRICEAFINDPENAVRDLEKSTADVLFVDGEAFFRFFVGDGVEGEAGQTKIVPLVPWGITGIKHQPGFWRRVISYHYQITEDNGDDSDQQTVSLDEQIPAKEVHHIAINRLSYERRGRPDMFSMLPWLQAHKEWLENRARQNFWRGAVLFWVKLINALPAQVASKLAAYRRPPQPGSVVVTNDKEEWTQFSPNVGASDASEDGRQMRAMAAVGARLPEAWLSDGANANLATATAQALPAVTSFGEMQDIMREKFWKVILCRVIENAIEGGQIAEDVQSQDVEGQPTGEPDIAAVDAFDVGYSEIVSVDPKNVVEALAIAFDKGWLSKQTALRLTPWDVSWGVEVKQRKQEGLEAGALADQAQKAKVA
jgi:hypothetical protein